MYSLYPYEAGFQKLLIQYKDLYDEALYPVFLFPHLDRVRRLLKDRSVVCIPSHPSHVEMRGFNHVERMLHDLNITPEPILSKISERHQARTPAKFRKERLFEVQDKQLGDCILIDDMCTTGESLRQAAELLKPHCEHLICFSVGYHPLLEHQVPSKSWRK